MTQRRSIPKRTREEEEELLVDRLLGSEYYEGLVYYQVQWQGQPKPAYEDNGSWIIKKNAGKEVLGLMAYFDFTYGRPTKVSSRRIATVTFAEAETWALEMKEKEQRRKHLRKRKKNL